MIENMLFAIALLFGEAFDRLGELATLTEKYPGIASLITIIALIAFFMAALNIDRPAFMKEMNEGVDHCDR